MGDTSEFQRGKASGYANGYAAGRKKGTKEGKDLGLAMGRRDGEREFWDSAMISAMSSFVNTNSWGKTVDGVYTPWKTMQEFAEGAASMADAMLKVRRHRRP